MTREKTRPATRTRTIDCRLPEDQIECDRINERRPHNEDEPEQEADNRPDHDDPVLVDLKHFLSPAIAITNRSICGSVAATVLSMACARSSRPLQSPFCAIIRSDLLLVDRSDQSGQQPDDQDDDDQDVSDDLYRPVLSVHNSRPYQRDPARSIPTPSRVFRDRS